MDDLDTEGLLSLFKVLLAPCACQRTDPTLCPRLDDVLLYPDQCAAHRRGRSYHHHHPECDAAPFDAWWLRVHHRGDAA